MSCKSALRNMATVLVASACAVLFLTIPCAHAQQMQVLGASPAPQDSAPEVNVSQRLILHDISVHGVTVDRASVPVLDYAVQLLRQYPDTRVYLSGRGNRDTVRRQAQAVARYLEQRGISANRLVRQEPVSVADKDASKKSKHGVVIVLNLVTPDCVTYPS